jgi:hypothetical protein
VRGHHCRERIKVGVGVRGYQFVRLHEVSMPHAHAFNSQANSPPKALRTASARG